MPIEKSIPMDEIWDKLGSDTYISSFGKNESIADVAKKHHQKAHIRLSGNAKEYIDKRLNELENGDCCHAIRSCSKLLRTPRKVPRKDAADMPGCSKCVK